MDIEQALFRSDIIVTEPLSKHRRRGNLLTIDEYRSCVEEGFLIDYDGSGLFVRNDVVAVRLETVPSKIREIPVWVTHILWFNR
jgi:hypothetical protein